MKKFILCAVITAALLAGAYYMIFFHGLYIPRDPDAPVSMNFITEGTRIYQKTDDGTKEPFEMKGVELSSSMPGSYSTDFAPDKQDYLRWLSLIDQMGANTVKVSYIMDDDFYNAFYEYNKDRSDPLYLLQQIPVPDSINYGDQSSGESGVADRIIRSGKTLVDIIHGRKSMTAAEISGGGSYRKSVSPWVLGFVVGHDWNPDFVAYSNHIYNNRYDGMYFSASTQATAFESFLARIMDKVTAYETEKYGTQHLIGFSNSPDTDFLRYEENYAYQLKKYSFIDAEHVIPQERLKSGYFAAYHLYDYCDTFSDHLEEAQSQRLAPLLTNLDYTDIYGGYLRLLARYHTMPVLSSGYGISSARGVTKMNEKPLTELEQGEKLMAIYQEATDSGWSGLCISYFQDIWNLPDWNTAFAESREVRYRWGDIQTSSKNYGLMAYEPGETSPACVTDGQKDEWSKEDIVVKEDGLTLSARYDWKGLYLLIEGDFDPETDSLFVPLDISDQVGSSYSDNPALTFDRNVDFLLCINGRDNSRLLVHERYQATRQNFGMQIYGVDPFTAAPDKDSGKFVSVTMAVENNTLLSDYISMDPNYRRALTAVRQWETGKLTYGNGDPASSDYCSLADFCFGDHFVEIRLPWLLINVGDPVYMRAHEDYYENYGVELSRIDTIWMGVSSENDITLSSFPVKGFGRRITWHERLKQSYKVIRKIWS